MCFMLLLDVRVPHSAGRGRSVQSSLDLLTVVHERLNTSDGFTLEGEFFFPVYSRSNRCQYQQPDYDIVTIRLLNYQIKSSIQ